MKKVIMKVAAICLVAGAMVTLTSCEKEKKFELFDKKSDSHSTDTVASSNDGKNGNEAKVKQLKFDNVLKIK